MFGGATAWSGGWMWAPLNPLSQADGIVEDIEAPRTYLKHALGDNYDEPRVEALLENSRHMVAFFEEHTTLQFVSSTWIADIPGTLPGAGTGGRSMGPKPINARRLGEELRRKLRPQLYETPFPGMGIMAGPDLQAFLHATTSVRSFLHAAWRVAFHVVDLLIHRQGMRLVNGPALLARLLKSAADHGGHLWADSPATSLLTEDCPGSATTVTGAVVSTPEDEVTVRARRGVLLAAGGFPQDVARRRASWLVCDHAFQRRYPFGMSKPFPVPVWPYVRSGYLTRGRTLEELARRCGIDPVGLTQAVEEFNKRARAGDDPEFGCGTTAFNRGSGDPEHRPTPSLAPIGKVPFYAIKVLPGSFGTFAGLKTDAHSRVLNTAGDPIPASTPGVIRPT